MVFVSEHPNYPLIGSFTFTSGEVEESYHLVKEASKKPRKTVSSSNGANTPVTRIKDAVLSSPKPTTDISYSLSAPIIRNHTGVIHAYMS